MDLTERHCLVDRANELIVKYQLSVPRFFSTRFINFEFWSTVFSRIVGIKCDITLRTPLERVEMVKSCLHALESLIGESLDHIRAEALLHFDLTTMKNLIEIAELWDYSSQVGNAYSLDIENNAENDFDTMQHKDPTNNDSPNPVPKVLDSVDINRNVSASNVREMSTKRQLSSKSQELANLLYKSLKNQTLSMEIEKKIKMYLGDVTVASSDFANLRASRQSIVRTRAIQPTSTFDFNFQKKFKRNPVLSADLEKLFPEISGEVVEKIRQQELKLIMSERSIHLWYQNLALKKVNTTLNDIIAKQKQTIEILEKDEKEQNRAAKAKNSRAYKIVQQHSMHNLRVQRALLQKEIDQFYNESTAAFLNARSHLERILITEFSKVDANKKQQINEIRKYLQNHYETETDNLRSLLEQYDSM